MKHFLLFALALIFAEPIIGQTNPCFSSPILNFPISPQASRGIASGDLNNDGIPDLATANLNGSSITWAIMSANGGVSSASTISFGSGNPRALTIADFNGDSFGDIAAASTNMINLAMSNGTGGFTTSTLNVGNPFGIASGDINGDGNQDIVTANNGSNNVSVRLGNGDGTFAANVTYIVSNGPYFISLAHMNNDNFLDIITTNIGSDNVTVLLGVGDGTFGAISNYFMGGLASDPYSLSVGDFNNDGNNDVVVANYGSNDIWVMAGNSSGALAPMNNYSTGGQPFGITSGHYDDDANLDFAVSAYNGQFVQIFKGDGTGSFSQASNYTTSNSLGLMTTADFNGDGFSDIAVANYGFSGSGQGGAYVLLNHRAKITALSPTSFCPGGSVDLVANNGYNFVYNWSPINSTNDSITVNTASTQTLTISNADASCSTTATQSITINPLPNVSGTATPSSICSGYQTTLNGSGAQTYSWSNGVTNGVAFTPPGAGTYTVTGTDANGCVNTGTVAIAFAIAPMQEVCTVTVDSATGNFNVIVWEKPADIGNIDSFYIYRETALNIYSKIGATHKDSLSQYNDFAANPNSSAYRYKIATLDTCGNVSSLGFYHNTIHLQYLGLGNFQWNHYLVEGTGQVALAYNFYRDDIGTGPLNLLQSVSGNQTTFTDVNYASFPNARYRVDVDWNITCTPTRGPVNTTRSNIKTPTSIGINEIENEMKISVYPNPSNDKVNINTFNNFSKKTLEVYTKLGQLIFVKEYVDSQIEINLAEWNCGIYFFRISSNTISKNGIITKN